MIDTPVLITGGAGFIGSNLADRLAGEGHRVRVFDALSRAGTERNLAWLQQNHGNAIEFQQHDANGGETFDPVRTGFDHLGLAVDSRERLVEWQERCEQLGVTHTPIVDREYGSVLTFKDPDRIQLELFHLAPEFESAVR